MPRAPTPTHAATCPPATRGADTAVSVALTPCTASVCASPAYVYPRAEHDVSSRAADGTAAQAPAAPQASTAAAIAAMKRRDTGTSGAGHRAIDVAG